MAFAKQPGNIPDVISIKNTLKQLKCLNLEKPLIVTDNGYYSQKNDGIRLAQCEVSDPG